jgi:hypothetical protein
LLNDRRIWEAQKIGTYGSGSGSGSQTVLKRMLDLDDLTREFFSLVPFTSMGRNAFSTSGGSRLLSFLAEKVEFKL